MWQANLATIRHGPIYSGHPSGKVAAAHIVMDHPDKPGDDEA
jgi:hypothetical protein